MQHMSTVERLAGHNPAQDREETIEVPSNLYGLFLVEPLQMNPGADGWVVIVLVFCRAWFFILVTYFVQATYIVRLHVINKEIEGGQCEHDLHLQVVCIFVLAAAGFQELREIMDFGSLLYWLEVKSFGESLEYTRMAQGEVFNKEETLKKEKQGYFGFRAAMSKMANRDGNRRFSHDGKVWQLQGCPRAWKAICVIVIVIPRLVIIAALFRFATGFLVRAEEEKMVVDTVAALFILEIAGFIFGAFTTNEVKSHLSAMEGVKKVTSQWQRIATFMFVQFLYPLLCVSIAVGTVYYLRDHCDDESKFFDLLTDFNGWKTVIAEGFMKATGNEHEGKEHDD